MSLKSIRESYQNLLNVFTDAGVELNESQKSALDTFVLELESTMSKQRTETIKKTAKAVEAKMEKQYQAIFESIMSNMAENQDLASKIQKRAVAIDESKKIAEKVDSYLDLYVESVLPKKTIIDYDRMQKLEKIHESLKESLALNDDSVKSTIAKLEESYAQKQGDYETRVAKMQVELNEARRQVSEFKAEMSKLNESVSTEKKPEIAVTKDEAEVPAEDTAKPVTETTTEEVDTKSTEPVEECSTIDNELTEKKPIELTEKKPIELDEEIKNIMSGVDPVDEDDMLKTTPHNMNGTHSGHVDEEDFETMEIINLNNEGEIMIDDSDVISESQIAKWGRLIVEVN